MSINELRADYLFDKYIYSKDFSGLSTGLPAWFIPTLTISLTSIGLLLLIRKLLSFRRTFNEQSILLELTPPATTEKTAHATQELFKTIHRLGRERSLSDKLLGKKTIFSCEIVSTQKDGIRYLIRTSPNQVNNLKRNLTSYLPEVTIKTVDEYLPNKVERLNNYHSKVVEFNLAKHFAYPLQRQKELGDHDPVAYITGAMTKLSAGELMALQIILSPTHKNVTSYIKYKIIRGEDVLGYIDQLRTSSLSTILKFPLIVIWKILSMFAYILRTVVSDLADAKMAERQRQYQYMAYYSSQNNQRPVRVLTQFEQEVVKSIEEKIDQPLFEANTRLFVGVNNKHELNNRIGGLCSSLNIFSSTAHQELKKKWQPALSFINNFLLLNFRKRLLSFVFNSSSTVLSISEISDLYHFPFTKVTQTENLVKVHSKELPAPLSLKRQENFDITFAKNTYGGTETMIGLTEDERRRHMYILGATGTGKSTMLLSMVKHDIENGKGLCVVDPHGDLAEKLLSVIPDNRIKDVIYFNPDDISYPIGINLLELSENLDEEESLKEKEFVTESIISLFHKLYPEKYSGPRMEYILRNTIHTAFTTKSPTLFTIYKLLINPKFRKEVTEKLTDENLIDFWKYEFAKAGDYQKVKMISPITNKIGRFLFSPSAKRILEQEKSTINFDEIMDQGKILICNLSKGKLGEDNSAVFGGLILAKIQLASLKRARIAEQNRKDFYLYVDEFQNFATPSFAQILSEARKYRLNAILAHQTTSQLEDKSLVNITLANTGTVICFKTANPEDENMILPQFSPYIEQGEILNLPAYHFYIKISASKPEESFSGVTINTQVDANPTKNQEIIKTSRNNFAKLYIKPKIELPTVEEKELEETVKPIKVKSSKPSSYLTHGN